MVDIKSNEELNGNISSSGTIIGSLITLTGPRGPQGEQGDKGEDGTGVNILGSYDSLEDLKNSHITGNIGDAYMIDGDLYVWSNTTNEWVNVGNIQGPQGEQGPKGDTGATGNDGKAATITIGSVIIGESETSADVTNSGTTNAAILNFTIPKGAKGEKGDKGDTGLQGSQGIQGEKGETGESGVYTGETEPTDLSVKVWIKPDAEADINGDDIVTEAKLSITKKSLEEQIVDSGIIVSPTEPTEDRKKVWIQKGKNLFDANNLFAGYRFGSDGILFADSSYSGTDFIPVTSNTDYIANWALETRECICYYDETKTFISRNIGTNLFTTPENCKYIRASRLSTEVSTAQIEQGTTATTYEEYIEPKLYVKNDNDVYEEFYRKEDINDLITTQNFTSSEITVATNSFKTSLILVKKAGYTPKGIVMADMSNNNVILSKFSLFGTTVYINLLNYSGSDQTTTVTVKVLYAKTTN